MSRMSFVPDWRRIVAYLRDPKSDWKPKAALVAALVYILWPVDLIPDIAPVLGWLDDAGLTTLAVWYLIRKSKSLPPSTNA